VLIPIRNGAAECAPTRSPTRGTGLYRTFPGDADRQLTEKHVKEWGSVFNDSTVAAAIIDRLAHRSEVIIIEGKSHRFPEGEAPVAD